MNRLISRVAVAIVLVVMATGCNLSPLRNRIKVGEEPIVTFVGEGIDGNTDLFVVPAGGGSIIQLTFTPLRESMPRINWRGDAVAFIRSKDSLPTTPNEVVLMNLLNGAERKLALPDSAGRIEAIAWAPDTNSLYVRSARGTWRVTTPPLAPEAFAATGDDLYAASIAFDLWVGDPPFAVVYRCPQGGVCAVGKRVDTTVISTTGHDPLRWGTDSIAWFEGDGMVVRSIGPGPARRVLWKHPPAKPRDGSYSGVTDAGR